VSLMHRVLALTAATISTEPTCELVYLPEQHRPCPRPEPPYPAEQPSTGANRAKHGRPYRPNRKAQRAAKAFRRRQ